MFHDRVISSKSVNGRDWRARSPDLNPLDYFLWGYLKSKVYCPKPNTLLELEANIQHEVRRIPAAMINANLFFFGKEMMNVDIHALANFSHVLPSVVHKRAVGRKNGK